MQYWIRSPRVFLSLALLIGLCAGMFAPHLGMVSARPAAELANPAPLSAVDELNIVISEFRFVGPGGGNDEFIEVYNPSYEDIPIGGWKILSSNASGVTSTRFTFPNTATLLAGQYYLVAHPQSSTSILNIADAVYANTTGITEDGGIALTLSDGTTIVDAVGLSSGSAFKEGTTLPPLSGSANQSYERKRYGTIGSCFDTNDNAADFIWNQTSSNPQNTASPVLPCLVVSDVDSSTIDGMKVINDQIDILVTFTNNVNVTGTPLLQLETGIVDQYASYISGSGTNSLTFRYTVQAGDSSNDLDYISPNALFLNGGTITGAVGEAVLILPKPGNVNSLSYNKDIQIDAGGAPYIVSVTRQNPIAQITNSNSITFRAIFSEAVINIDPSDFVSDPVFFPNVTFTLVKITDNVYDIVISGPAIDNYGGNIGLALAPTPTQDITDINLQPLDLLITPAPNEVYTLDNIKPAPQIVAVSSNAAALPVTFSVDFSEPIDPATFTPADIIQNGSVTGVVWTITNSGNNRNFTISATTSGSFSIAPHTITPSIPLNRIKDVAGNDNDPSSTDTTEIIDSTGPIPSITRASGQTANASSFPIRFVIDFGEPINISTFTVSDVSQTGTAAGVVWSITNSGDNRHFNLNATTAGTYGTIIPSIAANRVADLLGNNNGSVSGDVVTYGPPPTPTKTSTPAIVPVRSVLINEIAWAGTSSSLINDEWIELYNPGNKSVNITGWRLKAADGGPDIVLNGVIPAKGYFLLERGDNKTISNIQANQIYSGSSSTSLSNLGEALFLYDTSNKIIDSANGNGGIWPAGSSTTYGSMERNGNIVDSDGAWHTNNGSKRNGKNANDGKILGTPGSSNSAAPIPTVTRTPTKTRTPTPTRTPTRTPTPIPPSIEARLIINEILARPGLDWNRDGSVDVYDEFIEIKNLSPITVDLKGWKLDDQAGNNFAPFNLPSASIPPGGRIVFFRPQTNLPLSDGGGTVRLLNPQNKVFDEFTYIISRAEDRSFCRIPDGSFVASAWKEDCIPTPNLANTREGQVPSVPGGAADPLVCTLPDTIPAPVFLAECQGYGGGIWNSYYWDASGWGGRRYLPAESKWQSYIE